MVYTPNVPQGNQTIASTQAPINGNFTFLHDALAVEHNVLNSNAAVTYHLQASMPNQALSPSFPVGTDGVYFSSSTNPYYYDGTTNWRMNDWEAILKGTYTPSSASTFSNIVAIPANKVGLIVLSANSSSGYTQTGAFSTSGSRTFGFSNRIKINGSSDDYPVELNNNNNALFLQGRAYSSGYTGITYTYTVFYRPF